MPASKLPGLRIRKAKAGEAAALSAIAKASKAHWNYTPAQLASWKDELTISEQDIAAAANCVAEFDGKAVAVCVLERELPFWSIEHFWVLPSSMGRGIGRALLEHAAGLASDGGSEALAIDADPNAEAFYLACGAERVGTTAAPSDEEPERERPQLILRTRREAAARIRRETSGPNGDEALTPTRPAHHAKDEKR